MSPSREGQPTKAKEAPSPHEVRLTLLDTNLVFQCLVETKVRLENLKILGLSHFLTGKGMK